MKVLTLISAGVMMYGLMASSVTIITIGVVGMIMFGLPKGL